MTSDSWIAGNPSQTATSTRLPGETRRRHHNAVSRASEHLYSRRRLTKQNCFAADPAGIWFIQAEIPAAVLMGHSSTAGTPSALTGNPNQLHITMMAGW